MKIMKIAGTIAMICALPQAVVALDPDGNTVDLLGAEGTRTVCAQSTSNLGIDWRHTMTVNVSGGAATIVSGFITGTICDSPNWSITGGSFSSSGMLLNAIHTGSGSCASTLTMIGDHNPSPKYKWTGTYGWNGATDSFPHDTQLLKVGPCN